MQTRRSRQPHIGAILVGGRSTRFGTPKALAKVGGRTVLERILAVYRSVLPSTLLVTDAGERPADPPVPGAAASEHIRHPAAPDSPPALTIHTLERTNVEIVRDKFPEAGPLGGIHAALVAARAKNAVGACVAACDMPFVEETLLGTLLTFSDGRDAVVPVTGKDRLHPLLAWYSSELVEQIEDRICSGRLTLRLLVRELPNALLLPVEEIPLRRPPELVFLNVNTPADLVTAERAIVEFPDEG